MRAALYIRVSTEEQGKDDKVSLAYQEERCRAYCAARGYEVVQLYADVHSGRKWNRPELQRMLDAARNKAFDVVVFMKLDRIARNLRDLVNMEHDLQACGVGIASATENAIDTSTPSGRAMFQISGTFAELEVATITERMKMGIVERVKSGRMYRASTAPYGYRYDAETKQLVVRDDTAGVVRRIYQLYLAGNGPSRIATLLNGANVPPPADEAKTKRVNRWGWHKSRIRHILSSAVYRGEGHYNDVSMPCPRIVDDATWTRAQELMESRAVDGPRTRRAYVLQGRAFCALCGGRITPYTSSGGQYTYYKCLRRAQYSNKREVVQAHADRRWSWPTRQLDDLVKGFIDWWMKHPQLLAPHVERGVLVRQRAVEESLGEVNDLTTKLSEVEAQETRVLELARRGVYEGDQFERELRTVRSERNRLSAELSAAERRAGSAQDTVAQLLEFRQRVLELAMRGEVGEQGELKWEPPTTDEGWRQLVRYMIDRVLITGKGDKVDVKFEGTLVVPSPDEASERFVITNPSPR